MVLDSKKGSKLMWYIYIYVYIYIYMYVYICLFYFWWINPMYNIKHSKHSLNASKLMCIFPTKPWFLTGFVLKWVRPPKNNWNIAQFYASPVAVGWFFPKSFSHTHVFLLRIQLWPNGYEMDMSLSSVKDHRSWPFNSIKTISSPVMYIKLRETAWNAI